MLTLGAFIGITFLVACSGAYFKPDAWYRALAKPPWNPPDWVFGPAWAVIYLMIAVAGWRVWERAAPDMILVAMAVYGVQLALNAGWSAVFFGLKRPDWAFGEVVLLWASILANIVVFHPVDPVSAWLLVPYLAWVTFAGALNFTVWRLNKGHA